MAYDTNYPTAIPDLTDLPNYVDNVDDVEAKVVNDPKVELLACLNELGILPSGSAADLTTRLAVSINDDGSLKSTLSPSFVNLTLSGTLNVNGNNIASTGHIYILASGDNDDFMYFYTESNIAHLVPVKDSLFKIGESGKVFGEGWFDKITCDGDLTLDPGGNDVILDNAHLQVQSGYAIKHLGTGDYYIQNLNGAADAGWFWEGTYDQLIYRFGGIDKFTITTDYVVAYGGIGISTYTDPYIIDNSAHGSSSAALYIGNHIIAVSDADTGGAGSAGAGNQYVEIKIGANTYKVLHDGTV